MMRGWQMVNGVGQERGVLKCAGGAQQRRSFRADDGSHSSANPGTGESSVVLRLPPQSTILRSCALLIGFSLLHSAFCLRAVGQTYSVDWYSIAGGGGTSAGGTYQISGTSGQPDASGALTGGSYSLTGGFWSLISVVQTAVLPNLTITSAGHNVIVSWPATGSYTLQQNCNLAAPGSWLPSGYAISTRNGTSSITVTSAVGHLFFRLVNP